MWLFIMLFQTMQNVVSYGVKQDREWSYINTGMGAFIELIFESYTSGLVVGSHRSQKHG